MLLRKKYILFLLACCGLWACTHKVPEETLRVVIQADSLWQAGKMYGIDEGDSLALAQAYETIGQEKETYADEYVHACYHYGKLLRAKDDPEEAMRCFINATHSDTHDYHILGRVYSNMGDMCHLAGEYQLSYEMFEQSANMFMKNGDTLLYYYGLNNMAYELAEQGRKEETLSLVDCILQNNIDSELLDKAWETKAEMYRIVEQFDSAIYCANHIRIHNPSSSLYHIIKAQAFYRLGMPDSSLFYAKLILSDSLAQYENKFNALYLVSNIDSTLNKDDIREIASQREDIRYYDYEPEKEKLIYAVQLLRQKPQHKTSWMWLYAIAVIVLFMGSIFLWRFIVHKRKMISHVKQLKEKQTDSILLSIKQHIDTTDINRTLHWKNYALMKADADLYMGGIVRKLENYNLNETEIRLCILVLIGLNRLQIADTLPYASNSVGKLKDHTAKSLGTTGKNLRNFLLKMVIED